MDKQAEIDKIMREYAAKNREIEKDHFKNMARISLGTILSGASAHPVFNIPYIGTGIGGAMYDLGQGIVEGDKINDLVKRAARGFVIGETAGAIPYVGKFAGKTKAGQAIGKQFDKVAQKVAANPAVQKAYDVLTTDIKAFNPNKQTVYHGSPTDFNKFDNAYIGTGEGAQAHGYGHYAAKSKDVAQEYANILSKAKAEKNNSIFYKGKEYNFNNPVWGKNDPNYQFLAEINNLKKGTQVFKDVDDVVKKYTKLYETGLEKLNDTKEIEYLKSIGADVSPEKLSKLTNEKKQALEFIKNFDKTKLEGMDVDKQLYKLSIPKDDVMLREDLLLSEQPKFVQNAFKDEITSFKNGLKEELQSNIGAKNILLESLENAKAKGSDRLIYAIEKDIERNMPVYDTKIWQLQDQLNQNIPAAMNKTGRTIYEELGKNASDILSNKGIKGISYNGGIDGEANVIFNPDDIEIVRKYYNQPSLKDLYSKFINAGAYTSAATNP